jgi:rod shape determining protein RodA
MVQYVGTRAVRARRSERELSLTGVARRLDWVLLAGVAALVGLGLWAIGGITRYDVVGDPRYYESRQAIFAAVGAVGLVVAIAVDPDLYRRYWRALYGLMVSLVVLVYLAGPLTRGSKRWIEVGFFRFQPSEFGKLLFALTVGAFLVDRAKAVRERRTVLAAFALALVPIFLVFIQPDVGTALVYGAALFALVFVAGSRWTHLAALATIAVAGAVSVLWLLPAAGIHILKPYQAERLYGFTNPGRDPAGATYNVEQSKTAIGAGGFHGRGVSGATQTNLNYLPEHATDFVFASYAEQRGFVGASVLLGLYLLVVWRGLRIMARARDPFSAVVAGGIIGALLFQIFVNVGMTMGIAPVTGIPLPFVSVGGSSLITNLLAMGVLEAIAARGRDR